MTPRSAANQGGSPRRNGSTRQWRKTRAAVLERDGRVCRYCGKYANTVDHVVPVAKGGSDHPGNLVAACAPCNGHKGAKHKTSHRSPRW